MKEKNSFSQTEFKKRKELGQIFSLIQKCHLREISTNCERPDFKFYYGNKAIGIEVVGIEDGNRNAVEKCVQDITDTFENYLNERGYHNVLCNIILSDNLYLQDKIRNIKTQILGEFESYFERIITCSRCMNTLLTEVPSCFIPKYNFLDVMSLCWVEKYNIPTQVLLDQCVECRPVTIAEINRCVAIKDKKLQEYKLLSNNKDIKEYWLAISLPWYRCSGSDYHIINNDYDHVYLIDGLDGPILLK